MSCMRGNFASRSLLALSLAITMTASCANAESEIPQVPVKVEIVEKDGSFTLLRGGQPYVVKGAGVVWIEYSTIAERGGNSVRTWGIDHAQARLDAAHRNGLSVSLNLPIVSERFGLDYDNKIDVLSQLARVQLIVNRYKNHPALLSWIIGNELNYASTNLKVYDAVNEISKVIHQLDPNHLTTTTLTAVEPEYMAEVLARVPDLDFISIQMYGAIAILRKFARESLEGVPFMVTEWGPLGHWEVGNTRWGAPIEMTSTEKAERILNTYEEILRPLEGHSLGSYVFLWGQKQERTSTWYSMYLYSGEATESVDAMQRAWTGDWPANRAPRIKRIRLHNMKAQQSISLEPGKKYRAVVRADDPDKDQLSYYWSVRKESTSTAEGGDAEAEPPELNGLLEAFHREEVVLLAPRMEGAYRLFVEVFDDAGHAAHANIPFFVATPR